MFVLVGWFCVLTHMELHRLDIRSFERSTMALEFRVTSTYLAGSVGGTANTLLPTCVCNWISTGLRTCGFIILNLFVPLWFVARPTLIPISGERRRYLWGANSQWRNALSGRWNPDNPMKNRSRSTNSSQVSGPFHRQFPSGSVRGATANLGFEAVKAHRSTRLEEGLR